MVSATLRVKLVDCVDVKGTSSCCNVYVRYRTDDRKTCRTLIVIKLTFRNYGVCASDKCQQMRLTDAEMCIGILTGCCGTNGLPRRLLIASCNFSSSRSASMGLGVTFGLKTSGVANSIKSYQAIDCSVVVLTSSVAHESPSVQGTVLPVCSLAYGIE
jgi:hypothetical protein